MHVSVSRASSALFNRARGRARGLPRGLIALLLALGLTSCGPQRNQFAPACPVPDVPKPLAELTRYRGASQDYRDLVIRARISNVAGKCEPGDDRNTVVVTSQVVIDLVRGPAMQGRTYVLPLFVAITDADAIRDKTLIGLSVAFTPNVDTARALSQEVRIEIPVTPDKSAAAYGIIAGFQLSPEEVAAWRRNNRR
jgi:selenophosphate synthase